MTREEEQAALERIFRAKVGAEARELQRRRAARRRLALLVLLVVLALVLGRACRVLW